MHTYREQDTAGGDPLGSNNAHHSGSRYAGLPSPPPRGPGFYCGVCRIWVLILQKKKSENKTNSLCLIWVLILVLIPTSTLYSDIVNVLEN